MANRVHSFDYDFFEEIDNPIKAYWAGFIVADGCVSGNSLIIVLHKKDREHLEQFANDIESTYPMPIRKNVIRLCVTKKKTRQDLERFGIVARKTFKTRVPMLSDALLSHFFRGYFDGDGSIYADNVNCPNLTIQMKASVCGTQLLVDGFRETANAQTGLSTPSKWQHKSGIYYIRYSGNLKIQRLHNWLYRDADRFLKRKHNRFLRAFELAQAGGLDAVDIR